MHARAGHASPDSASPQLHCLRLPDGLERLREPLHSLSGSRCCRKVTQQRSVARREVQSILGYRQAEQRSQRSIPAQPSGTGPSGRLTLSAQSLCAPAHGGLVLRLIRPEDLRRAWSFASSARKTSVATAQAMQRLPAARAPRVAGLSQALEVPAAMHPVDVGALGADAAMLQADLVAYPVERAWLRRGNVAGWGSLRHGGGSKCCTKIQYTCRILYVK